MEMGGSFGASLSLAISIELRLLASLPPRRCCSSKPLRPAADERELAATDGDARARVGWRKEEVANTKLM
jgi:hypothetical protein